MANPTTRVESSFRHFNATKDKFPVQTGASLTFQTGELVGQNVAGYAVRYDDAASLRFLGLYFGLTPHKYDTDQPTINPTIDVECPFRIGMPLNTGSASRATDIGKRVYAFDSGKVIISPAALVYANLVGTITDVLNEDGTIAALTGTSVEIAPARTRKDVEGATRFMAATGAQSLTRFDLGKNIVVPNTAALTITLPPVAQTCAGDFLQFMKSTADAEIITLDGNASETIDNATTYTAMDARYDCVKIVSTGAEWIIVGRDIA